MKKWIVVWMLFMMVLTCFSVSYAGTFNDILDTKYEGVVESLAFLHIVEGVDKNIFDANKIVTRAEISKMLVVAHGYEKHAKLLEASQSFEDVKPEAWYYDYVNIASAYGLVKGYPDGKFYPDREVTYAEAVAMIMRSLGHNYIKEDSEYGWEYNYIVRMRDVKLNEGIDVFYNDRGAKRGDVAILIWNMLNQTTWEVIEEEGTGNLTYTDSHDVLLEKAFGKNYQLIRDKKIRSISALDGIMYATVESLGEVEINDVLPIYAVGSKVNGVYNKKEKVLSCATYDVDVAIVDDYAEKLEEEGYALKKVKDKYYFGGRDEDYMFLAVKRDGADEIIDRAIVLDLDNKILIDSTKTEKDILTINGEIEIDTTDAILLEGKRVLGWNKIGKNDSILYVGYNLYILANDYKSEDEITREEQNKKKNDNLYYISSLSYGNGKTYIHLVYGEKSSHYTCTADLKDFEVGDLVIITLEGNIVTKIAAASEKEYNDLKLGRELVLKYNIKTHANGMIGKYHIDTDTQIYVVNKKYENNSNTIIEKCSLEKTSASEFDYVDDEVINIIAEGNSAKYIYIERETNKFSVFYARVKDVVLDKTKIKLVVSPVDGAMKTYETSGKIECEIGDLISYTLSGKEGEEVLKIDEIYRATVIGYDKDLIVEGVNGKEISLTNGEKFDKTSSVITVDNKDYKVSKYIVISAKVRRDGESWVFSSTNFEELKSFKFSIGDRIAIDELEGVIVIYSGYIK